MQHGAVLELLEPQLQPGMRALDVGSGTAAPLPEGWCTIKLEAKTRRTQTQLLEAHTLPTRHVPGMQAQGTWWRA